MSTSRSSSNRTSQPHALAWVGLLLTLALLACLTTTTPTPPGVTSPPSCRADVTAKRDNVTLNGSQLHTSSGASRMNLGDSLALTDRGLADLKYGNGHKISLYAPQAGSSDMQITEWDGTREIAINAGAGYVVENAALTCKMNVVALGTVQIIATGTEYAFDIDPLTGNGTVVVFDGSVRVSDANGVSVTLTAQRGVDIVNMRLGTPFDFQETPGEIINNLESGLGAFGKPLRFIEEPVVTEQPVVTIPPPTILSGHIAVWSGWSDTEAGSVIAQAAKIFQDRNPGVTIDSVNTPLSDLKARFTRAMQAGSGPTLLIAPSDWGASFYENGLTADLTDAISTQIIANLTPAARAAITYRDRVIGFPLSSQGVVLYRNLRIFPEPFDSYEAMLEASKSATSAPEFYGLYFDTGFFFSGAHLIGIGGQLMDGDGFPFFNNDWGDVWLNMLADFQVYGGVTHYTEDDYNAFVENRAGLFVDGTWRLNALREAIGSEALAIDPWPTYRGGHLSGFTTTDNLYLNPKLEESDRLAALAFIEFLLSPEIQANLVQAGNLPVMASFPFEDAHLLQIAKAMQGNIPLPILPAMQYYWDPMDQAIRSRLYGVEYSFGLGQAAEEIYALVKENIP